MFVLSVIDRRLNKREPEAKNVTASVVRTRFGCSDVSKAMLVSTDATELGAVFLLCKTCREGDCCSRSV